MVHNLTPVRITSGAFQKCTSQEGFPSMRVNQTFLSAGPGEPYFSKVPPNDSDEPRGLKLQVSLYYFIFHIKQPTKPTNSNTDSRPVFFSMYTLSLWLRIHSLLKVNDHIPEISYLWRETEVFYSQAKDISMKLSSKPITLSSNTNMKLWKP